MVRPSLAVSFVCGSTRFCVLRVFFCFLCVRTDYRSTFVNLAISFVGASSPIQCDNRITNLASGELKWNLWSRTDIDLGRDITLAEFVKYMEEKFGLEVSMLSCGPSVLFMAFPMNQKTKDRLKMKSVSFCLCCVVFSVYLWLVLSVDQPLLYNGCVFLFSLFIPPHFRF
jgi:hypothetical protein